MIVVVVVIVIESSRSTKPTPWRDRRQPMDAYDMQSPPKGLPRWDWCASVRPMKEDVKNEPRKRRGCGTWLWLGLLLVLLGLFIALVFWRTKRNDIVRTLVIDAITKNGTCNVELGQMKISGNGSRIEIGPTLFTNPDIPGDAPLLEVASLKAELSPFGLLQRKVELTNLELDIPQVTLIRQADGSTNADCLGRTLGEFLPDVPKPKSAGKGGPDPALPIAEPDPAEEDDGKDIEVSIDRLALRIDNVSVRDFGRGGAIPLSADVEVNFDEIYEQLKSVDDLQNRLKADAENIVESLMIY